MWPKYHGRITTQALESHVSAAALEAIVAANLGQDAIRYQVGHDHYHYDNNSFAAGDAYLAAQRQAIAEALVRAETRPAWQAFGRLSHAVQDFYAHTNYVALWREHDPAATPERVSPLSDAILNDARLHSGRLYYPLEALSFVPAVAPFVAALLPPDSHARMNKDDPSRPDFEFAFAAAVKRTELEFQAILGDLSPRQAVLFAGKL
jgi:hypothetical protein